MPTFNLWTEPWITVETQQRAGERVGIEKLLLHAQEYSSIQEPSPLAVVGIHRLLVAILQAIVRPQSADDLRRLWHGGRFPAEGVRAFGKEYGVRFELFSEKAPFLQSGDLPLAPAKGTKTKTVAYLAPETPAGTEITHYRHGNENLQLFCAVCAARCLATIPPFATSGGAGIRPSINGVPPIYVLPGGASLFKSLAASLVRPAYQPKPAARVRSDLAWWAREAKVERGNEVRQVGYLHSLTFPARRVRLHPVAMDVPCTRCGGSTEWGVRTMVFEMGECRPKDAAFWFDPFAAYRLPKKEKENPTPIRPTLGKAVWREFAGLFLQLGDRGAGKRVTVRPAVLSQIGEVGFAGDGEAYPFRCVGMRTDMKAKVFEWVDAGFDVPPRLLRDSDVALLVDDALEFASDCAGVLSSTFRGHFGGSKKGEHHKGLRLRMLDEYWTALAPPFREFVLAVADADRQVAEFRGWLDTATRSARSCFSRAVEGVGDDGAALRQRVQAESQCDRLLNYKRKEYLPDD